MNKPFLFCKILLRREGGYCLLPRQQPVTSKKIHIHHGGGDANICGNTISILAGTPTSALG